MKGIFIGSSNCYLQDDLVCLPPKMAASNGNIFPILLCTRVTNVLTLMDPGSLRTLQIDVNYLFKSDMPADSTQLEGIIASA